MRLIALTLGNRGLRALTAAVLFGAASGAAAVAAETIRVGVITDAAPGRAGTHGLRALKAALSAKGAQVSEPPRLAPEHAEVFIVAGVSDGGGLAADIARRERLEAPSQPESLLIRRMQWEGQPTWLVLGADDRGLMYALLDVADRVSWAADAADPLSEVRDARESPAVPQRALSIYTMHRATFERRFFDEGYWGRYFDLLARNRFNSFVLIFGYENGGYFAPAYPYFVDVEGFPEVRVVGFTAADQRRYLRALNRLIELAHDRGLEVTVGLWDHIYRGGVQTGGRSDAEPGRPTPGIVWGLSQTNLMAYSAAALATFLQAVPGLDAVQFRMHSESGLRPGEEMREFWRDLYQVVQEVRPGLRFDARAKEFPDELIDLALDLGVNLRVCTKYWAEQMGLPFHPTHVNRQNQRDRRHGYADLLRYPQRYRIHWRLWNGGTTRVLLWGDPDYVRRFAQSTHLYDGEGFEVNEMLATKMEAQPHDQPPFELLRPAYRYYDYEFERYWHFYQTFGRVGYNPDTPPEVWQREFERRFGRAAAPHVERALHLASRILPRLIASVFPYHRFPTTRGWIEKQRWEDLPTYAACEGSDTQQFLSFAEAAQHQIDGTDSAKLHPARNSAWLAATARDVLRAADQAQRWHGPADNKELTSTLVDLRILANLALYHSRRIHAALNYALFQQTEDLNALDDALAHEREAVAAWSAVVAAAGDVYADDLMMGLRRAGLAGHWRDELAALQAGLAKLEAERDQFQPKAGSSLRIAHVPVRRLAPGEQPVIRATVSGPRPVRSVHLAWREDDGEFRWLRMTPQGPLRFAATLPAVSREGSVSYFLEAEDATGARETFPASGERQPLRVLVTADTEPPSCEHTPVVRATPGQPLRITAHVRDSAGVKWVRLLHRPVTQFEDYRTLEMQPTGRPDEFAAVVPGEQIPAEWDFMYLFEVMDRNGNGKLYPDFERETPYIVVQLDRR